MEPLFAPFHFQIWNKHIFPFWNNFPTVTVKEAAGYSLSSVKMAVTPKLGLNKEGAFQMSLYSCNKILTPMIDVA